MVSLSPTPDAPALPIDSLSLEQYPWRVAPFSAVKCCNARAVRYWHIASFRCASLVAIGGVADIQQAVLSRMLAA